MSVMNDLDLQCQDLQESMTLFADGEALPEEVALIVVEQLVYQRLPVMTWGAALPYMIRWVYDELELTPATRH